MATTDEHLPEDIIVQILYRLPVKPLIRFRCVSKRWGSIVSHPQFAKSQFKFASERKTLSHRLLLSTPSQLESFDLQTPSFPDDASVRKLTCPFKQPGRAVKLMGSCNGMLFVVAGCDFYDSSYIWNPSTGLLLELPNPPNEVTSISGLPHCGFGYVSATDDYKVFVAGRFRNSTVAVEMYSSKANSWKKIESHPHLSSSYTTLKGTFSNEALHWLVDPTNSDYKSVKPAIIAFDLVKEKFRKMPLLLLKQDDESCYFYSEMGVVFGGCLCVATNYVDYSYYCEIIQLWVMMEYDVCESWTKLVRLANYDDQLEGFQSPFVYWERSLVMFFVSEGIKELVRFDHKEEEEKLDKVLVRSGEYRLEGGDFDMIEYDESLLWLHDYQWAEGRRSRNE